MYYDETANPRRWYAVGIVSFGPSKCGQENYAGVYTRYVLDFFRKFLNFIHFLMIIVFFFLELTNISIGY